MTFKEFSANLDMIANAGMWDNDGEFMQWESIESSTPYFKKAFNEMKKFFPNERYMNYFLFNWMESGGEGTSKKETIDMAFNVGTLL